MVPNSSVLIITVQVCVFVYLFKREKERDVMIVCLTCLVCVLLDPCLLLKHPCTLNDITTMMTTDLGMHRCEVLPLMRSSACTDPATGVIMQATETPEVSSSDSSLSSQQVILTLVGGQSAVRPCCAVEQRTAWGLHAPVECTELDLQYLSMPRSSRHSDLQTS